MPAPQTPAEHREAAAALEAQAAQLREKAALAESAARLHRAMADMDEGLTTLRDSDRVNAMNASELSPNAQRSQTRLAYKDNRFVQAMAAKGETISAVARLLTEHFAPKRFHQNTVQGWYVTVGKGSHRDCPIEVREFLRDHYGKYTSGEHKGAWRVPLDSWPLERGR